MLRSSITSVVVWFIIIVVTAPVARAQIVYEPIQFQFIQHLPGGGSDTFYYGGHDPAVFAGAVLPYAGSMIRPRQMPLRVFTDAMPRTNAAIYGFTPCDAANEANANAARYFRKADVVRGKANVSGEMTVPAWAGSVRDEALIGAAVPMVRITPSGPHPLMVIPIPQRLQSPGTVLVVGKSPAGPPAQAAAVLVAVPVVGAVSLPAS
jgi:hypothetical protein